VVVAHPLTEPFQLPVSPLVSAWICTAIVLVVAFAWPPAADSHSDDDAPTASWEGVLPRASLVPRLAAVGLLVLCIAAGRLGANDELENLAPALVVGAAWPLLVFASALAGPVWRRLDPWDTMARLAGGAADEPSPSVWPAAFVALPWVWYLSAYSDTLEPRSVGALLALYSVFTIAGCLAVGRRRWLSSAEPLGILLAWAALLPQRRLAAWSPPRGAEALLGVLAGGILFGAARRSELWGEWNTIEHADLAATAGVLVSSAVGAGLLLGIAAVARIETPAAAATVARAAVPVVGAVIVAVAMERNRLTTSVQLLPGLLGDPFGEGWDLFGQAGSGLVAEPFGVRGLLLAQLGVVLAGHVAGAVVAASGLERAARIPVALGLGLLANVSVMAIATH
jgi:hypothetical protein